MVALFAFALASIGLAAQAGLAFCSGRVALAMPAMPGMTMAEPAASGHALMICPVVLVLIVASALLAALAIVIGCADPERARTHRVVARLIVRLPVGTTLLVLAGGGVLAVAAMLAVDGAGMPHLATCALLFALVLAGTFASVFVALLGAHVVLAVGQRLLLALASAIADRRGGRPPSGRSSAAPPIAAGSSCLLSTGLGLRAPPSFVR